MAVSKPCAGVVTYSCEAQRWCCGLEHCAPHSPWSLTEMGVKEENPPKPTNWKTTHHETRWPTWSLNAFEPKVSWGALQAKNEM